jgi:hypothetical protein
MLAEREVLGRIFPVQKKDQFVKPELKDKRISKMIQTSGLPPLEITPAFVQLLQQKKIIPAFW